MSFVVEAVNEPQAAGGDRVVGLGAHAALQSQLGKEKRSFAGSPASARRRPQHAGRTIEAEQGRGKTGEDRDTLAQIEVVEAGVAIDVVELHQIGADELAPQVDVAILARGRARIRRPTGRGTETILVDPEPAGQASGGGGASSDGGSEFGQVAAMFAPVLRDRLPAAIDPRAGAGDIVEN